MKDPLKQFPGYALKRASSHMMTLLREKLAQIEITPAEATILILIGNNTKITQTHLCTMIDMNKSNMTPRIAKLVQAGLVERKKLNGRSYHLHLTDEGIVKKDRAYEIMERHEGELMARISALDLPHFISSLTALWNPDAEEI